MSNNESPDNFISKLPPAEIVRPDITEGVIPMPPTGLLSESERRRLDELAKTGQAPVEPSAPEKTDELTTFEDGGVFKYMPRPGSTSQCILVDAAGQQIAIVKNENLADFLVNACNLFVRAQIKHEIEGTPMQVVHTPRIIPGV